MLRLYARYILLLAVVLWETSPAIAQSPSTRECTNIGVKKAGDGKFQEAVELWLALLDKVPAADQANLHLYMALAYDQWGKSPEAAYHYTASLKLNPANKDAAKDLAALEKKLAATLRKVEFISDPAGAEVAFSPFQAAPAGNTAGGAQGCQRQVAAAYPTPFSWWLPAGRHKVYARKPAFQDLEQDVVVNAQTTQATLKLVQPPGILEVRGNRRAVQVFLNGSLEGKVPFTRKLKPGSYELMVGPPGELPWKKMVTIRTGETLVENPEIALDKPPVVEKPPVEKPPVGKPPIKQPDKPKPAADGKKSRAWMWALTGGGAAMLVAGGILHGIAASQEVTIFNKYLDQRFKSPATYDPTGYDREFDSNVLPKIISSYVLYGVGGAAVATGAVLLFIDYSKGDKVAQPVLSPLPLPGGGGGLVYTMEF